MKSLNMLEGRPIYLLLGPKILGNGNVPGLVEEVEFIAVGGHIVSICFGTFLIAT